VSTPEGPTGAEQTVPTCYRHTGREAHVRCQRCGRNICGDCMRQASVGFQCPDCVAEGARTTRAPRTPYGGRPPATANRVTLALLGLNVVVFVLVQASGGRTGELIRQLWLLPREACWDASADGMRCLAVAPGVADGAYWQLLTSAFTHVQLWHIGFNLLAIYVLGPQLELLLGRGRYLTLYLFSALAGSVSVYWLAPEQSLTLGASGAVFGLMAALLIVAVRVRGDVQGLLTLVAINVVITVLGSSFISWQGHLGGFVGGLLVSLVLVYAPRKGRTGWQLVGVGLLTALLVVAVVVRTSMLT
jgi:membrane associated rhomboid family serine protease